MRLWFRERATASSRRALFALSPGLLLAALLFVFVAGASAAGQSAAWSVDSVAYPSNFSLTHNAHCEATTVNVSEENCDSYAVSATNVGSKSTGKSAITITDTLPGGVTARNVSLFVEDFPRHEVISGQNLGEVPGVCVMSPVPQCVVKLSEMQSRLGEGWKGVESLPPDASLRMTVSVLVNEGAAPGPLVNKASVSGAVSGAGAQATVTHENALSDTSALFGVSVFAAPFVNAEGLAEDRAGAHSYEIDTRIGFDSEMREDPEGVIRATSVEDLRDVILDLPLGMAGSAVSAPQCTLARLASKGPERKPGENRQGKSGCPDNTIIGHIHTYPESNVSADGSIYNLIPERGYAAELGFVDATGGTHVIYVSLAPTTSGYVLRTTTREIPQISLTEAVVNVFGDPSVRDGASVEEPTATFTNPASCDGQPLVTTMLIDSWQSPGSYNSDGTPNEADSRWKKSTFQAEPVTDCEALTGLFNPALTAQPSVGTADSPTGLDVNLQVPQSTGAEALGTPPVRETVVTLPEGLVVDPSSANGLGACTEAQIGWQGKSPILTGEYENFNASPPSCPDASKIGTIELETPALPTEACKDPIVPLQECPGSSERVRTPIVGSIYVAQPYANPFGSLLAIYLVVDDPRTGVVVKIPARVEANQSTGQLTTTVADTPQFPFSELRTHFYAGNNAALKTPATCGVFTTSSTIVPWSAPQSGPPATPSGSFEINQNANGGACSAPGFAPSFVAGTETNRAGAFSPVSVTFARHDGEQGLGQSTVTLPPGVSAVLTGVPLCPEPQAAQGTCGEASLIGEATSAVGAGPEPYWVHGAKVYLTGPYGGGPFGLSIVVPTTAGPYTLTGNAGPGREVVRASVRVDPTTAQVTAISDPLPTIIQGIPLDIKTVNVTINRPGFAFNPTNCNPLAATGMLGSTSGTTIPVTSRFQAADCSTLGFKPGFKVSSNGKTSKRTGASLRTVLTYPKATFGSQSNIATVKVSLPKQLPSNLKTLQKACPHQTFEANPASCSNESRVGSATATTPLLPVPLSGPAYFVSYGGAKFPELVIVLQGYGITIQLHGETYIDEHTNITTSTFHTIPDVPVNTFELNLPQGHYSALAAPTGLCAKKLVMPTTFTAQDGTILKQNTPINVSNCPKHKAHKHKPRKKRNGKRG